MRVVIGVPDRVVAADIAEWMAQQPSIRVDFATTTLAPDVTTTLLGKTLLVVQGSLPALADTVTPVLEAGGHVVWLDAPPEIERLSGNLRRLSTPFTVATLEATFLPILRT